MKCPECNTEMKTVIELVVSNGNSMPLEILKCPKCDFKSTKLENLDKLKKQFRPTMLDKFKKCFSSENFKVIELTKGKLL